MGGSYSIRPATEADCAALAPLMRAADADECLAAGFVSPLQALRLSLGVSEVALAVELSGELAAVCGVSLEGGTLLTGPELGTAWALTTPAVARHKRAFLLASRQAVAVLSRCAPVLVADVDTRYLAALRWAEWLGFTVRPARPIPPAGHLFHPILRRSSWVQ